MRRLGNRAAGRRFGMVALVAFALVATSCNYDWAQFGYGADHTRSSADAGLDKANVASIVPFFSGTTAGAVQSSPSIALGVAYVGSDDGKLSAFDATGASGCSGSPTVCAPLWTASLGSAVTSSPAVVGGVVYVGAAAGGLSAFDATGTTNCSGSPKACTPLWTAPTGPIAGSSPAVTGNVVYVGSTDGTLSAFDAKGTTNCTGSPAVCAPLWTAAAGGSITASPALASGRVFVGSASQSLLAFDAAGTTGCSGTPKVCTPLWSGPTGGAIASSAAVGGSVVYVGSDDGRLNAFDATGSTGCSAAPVTCAPLWTATTGGPVRSSPAVSGSVVYVGSDDARLYAFDATGSTGCSGAPKACTPLWRAVTGGAVRSSPAVVGNVVYVGSNGGTLTAYDAGGSSNCTGSPKTCTALATQTLGGTVTSSPAVTGGTLFVGSSLGGLKAFKPWVFARPTCAANPHGGLSPCQLQDAYRLPSLVAGKGRTVAIVDAYDDPNAEADLAVYRAAYGLPACTTANGCFKKLNQNGVQGSYPTADTGWAEEISLDLDMVSAICPLCNITLVEANSPSIGNLGIAVDTAAALSPVAISNSYGLTEFSSEASFDFHYTHPGIAITVSTGDDGYGTQWPAASPSVTAVGGTTLAVDSSDRGWKEGAWSGAGSGCSPYEAKPAWQADTGCAKRALADVSALAGSPGASVYDSYGMAGWLQVGGTSAAAPIIAAVYALAAPVVTPSVTSTRTSSLFDIVTGSNGSCGGGYLCTGLEGYDGPTGLGTPCGTAAFGAGPFTTKACPGASATPARPGPPAPDVVYTPACTEAPPGFARCHALTITAG